MIDRNDIDRLAMEVDCPRHVPHMKACRYDRDIPCLCRAATEVMQQGMRNMVSEIAKKVLDAHF